MRRISSLIIALAVVLTAGALTLPESTNKLVNDFAGIFSYEQVASMEARLEAFSDSTSNQICVVTIADLEDYEAHDFGVRLFNKWGVGSSSKKAKDNGVLILVKPRNEYGGGDVAIVTGYGVEGVLPDATCKLLIENVMIPYLKEGQYYTACKEAVVRIMPIMQGEYDFSKDELLASSSSKSEGNPIMGLAVIGIIILIIWLIKRPSKKTRLLAKVEDATTPEELEKAIAAARAGKVKESKIEAARKKVPARMLKRLAGAESPAQFSQLAAGALALGVGAAAISSLELEMPDRALKDLRASSSDSELRKNKSRAKAFGCSEAAIAAAVAAAAAAIAAAAAAAAAAEAASRRSSSYSSSSRSSSSGFGGFGGGRSGGGGASGKF